MFGRSITLFKLFGFAVRIDLSWLFIFALVIYFLSQGYFAEQYEDLHWGWHLAMGTAGAIGLFVSIIFHELSHSLVARQYGLPMKGITLFLFGGVAEMTEEPPSAKAEFMMAIAGPISSIGLGSLCIGVWALGHAAHWPPVALTVLGWIGWINLVLAAFNMIPGFPLDGGRALRAAIWHFKGNLRRATEIASKVGAGFGAVLIGLGLFQLALGLVAYGTFAIWSLWPVLIGLFIRGAAKQGYQQVLIKQALRGESVRRFMKDEPVTIRPGQTLEDVVQNYVYEHHYKMFPVVDNGELAGCLTTREIKEVPRGEWSQKTVGEVVTGCSPANVITADHDAMDALTQMNTNQVSRLMVVEGDRLVGVLTLKDLLDFLSLKLDLESEEEVRLPGQGPEQ